MGVVMAPVAGSGAWPAWMHSVLKRAESPGLTPRAYSVPSARVHRGGRTARGACML